jgi:hypothetical protein
MNPLRGFKHFFVGVFTIIEPLRGSQMNYYEAHKNIVDVLLLQYIGDSALILYEDLSHEIER